MPIAPLLRKFIDEEVAQAPSLAARVLAGTRQLLGPTGEDGPGASERSQHGDLMLLLQRYATVYEQAFVDSLRRRVHEETEVQRGASFADGPSGYAGLELMDESRVEADIEISRALQLIDNTAEWELRELQTFTSTLTGQRHVSAESNPFRPLVYASALWDAGCAVTTSPLQRAILLRTSAGVAAGLLKNAWAAASTRLEAQGVEPGLYRTVVLPSAQGFSRGPASVSPRTEALTALLASMPVVQPMVSARVATPARAANDPATARSPAAPRGTGMPRQSAEFVQAEQRLDEVLRLAVKEPLESDSEFPDGERIEQHRVALVASIADPLGRQVAELVTRLFDALRQDTLLPAGMRGPLVRLQSAVLHAALDDRSVLDSLGHPAWRLLDRMGDVAAGTTRPEDPRLGGCMALCGVVAEELARAAVIDGGVFQAALGRLESFLAEQLQSQIGAAQTGIDVLTTAERREVLQQQLAQRLADQLTPVRTTPAIRRFLTGAWARVIAENMLRHGDQSPAALGDLKTVDDLLWSLKIPDHPQSRQRLLQLLPGLLQRLRSGMALVAVPGLERQAVLNDLMAIHTEALRPGSRSGAGPLTPEQIVQRMRDEVLPDKPLSTRNFSDSVIDMSSMETVPAEHLHSAQDSSEDDPARRIEALRAGDRQRIFLHGRWNLVQLLWRSERGLFFLFAGETPNRPHSITRRALERLGSAGLLQPLTAKTLVQRSIEQMVRGLSSGR